eukprot:COSAG01_NODE_8504_length_2761_cov_1.664914_3_plen_103_part_00
MILSACLCRFLVACWRAGVRRAHSLIGVGAGCCLAAILVILYQEQAVGRLAQQLLKLQRTLRQLAAESERKRRVALQVERLMRPRSRSAEITLHPQAFCVRF